MVMMLFAAGCQLFCGRGSLQPIWLGSHSIEQLAINTRHEPAPPLIALLQCQKGDMLFVLPFHTGVNRFTAYLPDSHGSTHIGKAVPAAALLSAAGLAQGPRTGFGLLRGGVAGSRKDLAVVSFVDKYRTIGILGIEGTDRVLPNPVFYDYPAFLRDFSATVKQDLIPLAFVAAKKTQIKAQGPV